MLRHILQASLLVAICHVISIYTIDSPKQIYFCPIDSGLSYHWEQNCYWSASYAEAREKFVSLGNLLKEQVRLAKNEDRIYVLDVMSLSYDIAADNFQQHIKNLEALDVNTPQTIVPERDTVDGLLLTLRFPHDGKTNEDGEHVNIIHSSGTHGVEGYLGSAVQIRFLHELFMRNEERMKAGMQQQSNPSSSSRDDDRVRKVLLIHSASKSP